MIILIDAQTGKMENTLAAAPMDVPAGKLISLKDTLYGCNPEEGFTGTHMTHGEATVEIRLTHAGAIKTYDLKVISTNRKDFDFAYKSALSLLGFVVTPIPTYD